jgi:hypothetical protein
LFSSFTFLKESYSTAISFNKTVETKEFTYKAALGECPKKTAGHLLMNLVNDFQENRSLKKIKEKIVKEQLEEKFYLSRYDIEYDIIKKKLLFEFDCPKPLLKVQIYKKKNKDFFSAIMVEGGKIFDPNYEVVLRSEDKLTHELPFFSISLDEFTPAKQKLISSFVGSFDLKSRKKISEIILNKDQELIMLLSIKGRAVSVFFGKLFWEEKVDQLIKIISYLSKQNKIPSVINLATSKKVVVKFSNSL